MFIEGVTICVNYGDFLAHTLPYNKQHFNSYVVVTSTSDTFTKKVCDFYRVRCIQSDVFFQNNDSFNKGKGINLALDALSKADWVCHLDADIFLMPHFKNTVKSGELNKKNLYGIDRLMCNSYDDWCAFLGNPMQLYEGITNKYHIGTRIMDKEDNGYLPLGYFQLWNPKESNVYSYPDNHPQADLTDLIFAKNWERQQRILLPDTFVIHLDSEDNQTNGINWNGRKTPVFGKSQFEMPKKENNYNVKTYYEKN